MTAVLDPHFWVSLLRQRLDMKGNRLGRVWLVDDSDIDLFLLRRLMEITDFAGEIITYKVPAEALQTLTDAPTGSWPELIFLDLNMPVINGFQFLEKFNVMRSQRELGAETCRVVMVSSSTHPVDSSLARSFPFVTDFISKPLTRPQLQHLLRLLAAAS